MRFTALNGNGETLITRVYYSVGGGFVAGEATIARNAPPMSNIQLPLPFKSGQDLLNLSTEHRLHISEIMRENERYWHDDEIIDAKLDEILSAMHNCIERGTQTKGTLPRLGIKRRAPELL